MKSFLTNKLLWAGVIGALFGFLILHPLNMIANETFHWHGSFWHIHWHVFAHGFLSAFRIEEIPDIAFFAALSATASVLWAASIQAYRRLVEQQNRFALIGQEASMIVHDINNPLSAILGLGEVVQRSAEDPNLEKSGAMICSNSAKIAGIVAEIKTLASTDGRLLLAKQAVDLAVMIRKAASEVQLRAALDITDLLNEPVPVDTLFFDRVLWNVLRNSDEAIAGAKDPKILVTLYKQNNMAVMRIHDNGPGFPKDKKDRVFDLGFTFKKQRGSGLGLFAARRIIDSHGGSIAAANDHGAVVIIRLPL
jgi:signal transduction histidine kinase